MRWTMLLKNVPAVKSEKANGLVEKLAVATQPSEKLREVVLNEDFSWTTVHGLAGWREHRLVWLFTLLLPFFGILVVWSMIKYILYLFIIRPKNPVRRLLGPQKNLWLFDQAHWLLAETRNGVTSWTALAAINSSRLVLKTMRGIRKWVAWFWFNQPEAQAVRNRLLETRDQVYNHLVYLWEVKGLKNLQVVSLACGSAQATLDAIVRFISRHPEARSAIKLILVDLNGESLALARDKAKQLGIVDLVETVCGRVDEFCARPENLHRFAVVETVGYLDYRSKLSFIRTCNSAESILSSKGLFIAAQIGPSKWSMVTRWITGWPRLIRRSMRTFRCLINLTEFRGMNTVFVSEPHQIYHLVLCKKD